MHRIHATLIGMLLLAFAGSYAASQPPAARKGILSRLEVGQAVHVQSSDNWISIWIYEDEAAKGRMKDVVKEIGEDYVLLWTVGADKVAREIYLPTHSLNSIIVLKKSGEK